jgi:diguanylate cyclase (GGDEF)-like protein
MFACLLLMAGRTSSTIDSVDAYLTRAEDVRLTDHSRFAAMLAQIHAEKASLTVAQQWRLRYLDAWEDQFTGQYAKAEAGYRDIIDRSGDSTLAAKSTGLLLSTLAATRRYEDAFHLAKRAVVLLGEVRDPMARYSLLANLSQTLNFAGHPEIALRYARMMADDIPPGETICRPITLSLAARYSTHTLKPTDPDFSRGIEACTTAGQPVLANAIWLTQSELLVEAREPQKALAILDQVAASVRETHYFPANVSMTVQRATAYEQLGRDDDARQAALAAVGMYEHADTDEYQRDAYKVLYEVEKRAGNMAPALSYYQKYAEQERGYLNDVSARALAYEAVEQRTLVQKLEAEKLSRQNDLLELEQAITLKAVETSRLYIALLAAVLGSVVFWLFRVKRSQLRFRQLSHHDGLTGIYNHQHFMDELEAVLNELSLRRAPVCLVMLDLDHFKAVNDTYGHSIGDAVLRHVVGLCQQHLRPEDVFGRLGGEEFGVLLPGCDLAQGTAIADAMRASLAASPVQIDGQAVSCSTSAGVAFSGTSGYDLKRLRRDADTALYGAKRAGRNRVVAVTTGGSLEA